MIILSIRASLSDNIPTDSGEAFFKTGALLQEFNPSNTEKTKIEIISFFILIFLNRKGRKVMKFFFAIFA